MTSSETTGMDAAALKSCCAAAYESEWSRLLVGDSLHPGGVELTLHLGRLLGLHPGMVVVDVASGRGTSAIALAREFGCSVVGVDLSAANVATANAAAAEAGLAHLVRFEVGDAERLSLPDGMANAVICECAFCTFPDKPTAAAELARVLRVGGRIGITDLTRSGPLSEDLESLLGWVACVADARPADEYAAILEAAGLSIDTREVHDRALYRMLKQIHLKLFGAELAARSGVQQLPVSTADIQTARRLLRSAGEAVDDGRLGYALLAGRRDLVR